MDTGELIRNIRIKKGMTQRQLGQACGIDEANIRKYESGRQNPKYETIQKIAAALGVNTLELFPEYSKLVKKNEQNKQDKKPPREGAAIKRDYFLIRYLIRSTELLYILRSSGSSGIDDDIFSTTGSLTTAASFGTDGDFGVADANRACGTSRDSL